MQNLASIHDTYPERIFYKSEGSTYPVLDSTVFKYSGIFMNQRLKNNTGNQISSEVVQAEYLYENPKNFPYKFESPPIYGSFTTKSIWVDFRAQGCQNPTGSHRLMFQRDPYFYITNFNSKDCPVGTQVYADFTFKMTILTFYYEEDETPDQSRKYNGNFVIDDILHQYQNITVGTIGCSPKCKICKDDDYPYLLEVTGECLENTGSSFALSKIVQAQENSITPLLNYTQQYLVSKCPQGYFEKGNQCIECHSN